MSKLLNVAQKYNLDISKYDPKQLIKGMRVEKEHNDGSQLDVVDNVGDLMKIAMAHLNELPDYYDRLKKVEELIESPAHVKRSGALSSDIHSALVKNGLDDSQVLKVLSNTFAGVMMVFTATGNQGKLINLLKSLMTKV
jgi:hypothetical protein